MKGRGYDYILSVVFYSILLLSRREEEGDEGQY